jgi:hypothetical protein
VPSQPNPAVVMEIAPSASPVALAMAPVPDDPGAETVAPAKKRGWFS